MGEGGPCAYLMISLGCARGDVPLDAYCLFCGCGWDTGVMMGSGHVVLSRLFAGGVLVMYARTDECVTEGGGRSAVHYVR